MFINKIKVLLVVILLHLSVVGSAQNSYFSDDEAFHFGFSLGFNTMDFGVGTSMALIDGKRYQVDVSTLKPGFSVGIVTDMLISRYFNLRCTPTLHFGERELTYLPVGSGTERTSIVVPSVPICVPLYLKYSAERYGNLRPYLLVGGGVSFDMGTNKEKPIYLKPFDVYAEFGVGCDIYLSFFKLAPELKFAIGNNDLFIPLEQRDAGMLSESDKKYSLALSKLTSRVVTLTFNFE